MSPLEKGLLVDSQAVVGIEACCSCAGYSQMILKDDAGLTEGSRSNFENASGLKIKGIYVLGLFAGPCRLRRFGHLDVSGASMEKVEDEG